MVAHLTVICLSLPSVTVALFLLFLSFFAFSVLSDMSKDDFLYLRRTHLGFGVMLLRLWKSVPHSPVDLYLLSIFSFNFLTCYLVSSYTWLFFIASTVYEKFGR